MQFKEAVVRFDCGGFTGFQAEHHPIMGGWVLVLLGATIGKSAPETLETARGKQKVFKTLDALVAEARKIGFSAETLKAK